MHDFSNQLTAYIVLTVLLFMFLGIVLVVLIDHKAKIPGHFTQDPFSISGMRRGHPVISFLTAFILGCIILILFFEVFVALGSHAGLFQDEEEKKPELLQTLRLDRFTEKKRHFHHEMKEDKVNLGNKPVCFECHGDYPHSKEPMIRTLMNMHTQFAGCMTCHVDEKKVPEKYYSYKWLNYSGIKVKGKHFGTDIDPITGYLQETDDLYSKIVVYSNESGQEKLLEVTEDDPEVQDFLEIKDQLNDRDKEALKKRFHKIVKPKGRFCSRCHTKEEKSLLPFKELGFSERRISDLTNLNIIGIVEKYKKFYMPKLIRRSMPEEDTE
ncbi:MAG: hypothetical protein KAU21_15150 [Gammaproteobacteria bacterium]|nr:hypothetical protein [Gammaproteobacteria bacterium]